MSPSISGPWRGGPGTTPHSPAGFLTGPPTQGRSQGNLGPRRGGVSAFSGQRAPDPQEVLPSAFLRLNNPKGQPTLGQRGEDEEILSGRGSEWGQGTQREGRPHQGAHGMKISAFPGLSEEAGVEPSPCVYSPNIAQD